KQRKRWSESEIDDGLAKRYEVLLTDLLKLELLDVTKRRPHVLTLSAEAKRLFVAFYDEWADVQFNAEGAQAAAFAKIEAYAPRLALLHHVVAHVAGGVDDRREITATSMKAGIDLARWFAVEAVRIYTMLRETSEEQQTRELVEWIASRPERRCTVR